MCIRDRYDVLAQIGGGGRRNVPPQKHFSRKGAKRLFPGIRDDALVGAIQFYDCLLYTSRCV